MLYCPDKLMDLVYHNITFKVTPIIHSKVYLESKQVFRDALIQMVQIDYTEPKSFTRTVYIEGDYSNCSVARLHNLQCNHNHDILAYIISFLGNEMGYTRVQCSVNEHYTDPSLLGLGFTVKSSYYNYRSGNKVKLYEKKLQNKHYYDHELDDDDEYDQDGYTPLETQISDIIYKTGE